jgi:L-lactate dehydrogenase complex protein LldG
LSSREKILEAIRKNKPTDLPDPVIDHSKDEQADIVNRFVNALTGIGGFCTLVKDYEPVNTWIKQLKEQQVCVNAVHDLVGYNIHDYTNQDARALEATHTFLARGTVGVAENGAIWVTEKNMGNRLLPFLCQQLVLVVEETDLVSNMHEAYKKISIDEEGYGLFIAGPSKTADIEQSLVIGAHGPLRVQVFVIKNKN